MQQPITTVAIGLFVLLIVGMAIFTYLEKQEASHDAPSPSEEVSPSAPTGDAPIDERPATTSGDTSSTAPAVSVEPGTPLLTDRTFASGTHTLVGEIALPTPCHELSWEVTVAESFPEQVTIAFSTTPGDGMCAQVLTPAPFSVTVAASADATFSALFNGEPVPLVSSQPL